ncbi:MAG TPA: sigma-70 family RNA polymerase sigma factor [Candidatus Dormibacteraeota bacterium]|nr:sigma-70 family RNA polymerase sigma factor [Candidatus Dormibacteraeota bacterium]
MRPLEDLIRACAERGEASDWEEFVSRFHSLIASVVLRTTRRWDVTSPAVDDLIQETYLKICGDQKRLLTEFTPHHPEAFYGYLKVVASNVVHDYFRARHSQKRGLGQPEVSLDEAGSGTPTARDGADEIHRDILLREVDDILRSTLSGEQQSRDRIIFWLYYRYGLSAADIGRLPSISLTVKGVESVIHRLTSSVREHLAEREVS